MSPLKRRQFGKLAAASLTSTVVASISSKTLAQESKSKQGTLYGVKLLSTSNTQNPEDQTPPFELSTADLATGKIISKVNRLSLSVDNPLPIKKKSRAFFDGESNRITKAIALENGAILISTVKKNRDGYVNHLVSGAGSAINRQFKGKKVLNFESSNQTVESLLSLPNNQLLCLVGTEGIPPFYLRIIDLATGRVLSIDNLDLPSLPPTHRFSNFCQANGNIFATEIGSEGFPILISMNLQEKAILTGKVKIKRLAPLNYKGSPLLDDVKDLGFTSSGELYALAADNSRKNNALFTVNMKIGTMGLVSNFAAEKFVFSS